MEGLKQCPECKCTDVPMSAEVCPFCGHSFEKRVARPRPEEIKPKKPSETTDFVVMMKEEPKKTEPAVVKNQPEAGPGVKKEKPAEPSSTDYKAYRKKEKKKHGFLKFAVVAAVLAFVWFRFIKPSGDDAGDGQSGSTADAYSAGSESADSDGQMADAGDGGTDDAFGNAIAQATVTAPDAVKIRQEASTDSNVAGAAEQGEVLNVLSEVQGVDGYTWYLVQIDDAAMGYIRSDLVEITGDICGGMADGEEADGTGDALEMGSQEMSPEEAQGTSQFILPLSDQVYLTREDIEGLSAEELRIARNEIYARHGRLFKDEALQTYFNSCDWYVGSVSADDFSDSVFNEYEMANKDLIVSYEHELGVNGQ